MVSDSIANASIPMAAAAAAANSKDFPKKKRANRSAKLKQCKLDARREQWLSQGKNKGCKGESDGCGGCNESERLIETLEIKPRVERKVGLTQHYSDSDSASNNPTSHTSSVLGSDVSGMNFTATSGSNSSSSGGSCSGSITGEDEEGEDECLDDWEAVADALATANDKHEQHNPCSEPSQPALKFEKSNPKSELAEKVHRDQPTCRAWKADDAFRPQSLPNLSKQLSLPVDSRQHCRWGCKNVSPVPSSCPICCEDLDFTDSSFLPCSCGFRLCLFCHKRILEEDGRCPGCRKEYDHERVKDEATVDGGSLAFRLARSCSMIMRS